MRLTLLVLSLLPIISSSPSSYMASNDDEDYYYNEGVSGSGSGDDSPSNDQYDSYEYNERPIIPTESTSGDTSKIVVPEIDTDPTNNDILVETIDLKPKVRPHHEHKTVASSKTICFHLEVLFLLYQLI